MFPVFVIQHGIEARMVKHTDENKSVNTGKIIYNFFTNLEVCKKKQTFYILPMLCWKIR